MIFYEYNLPTVAPLYTIDVITDRISELDEQRVSVDARVSPRNRILSEIIEAELLFLFNMRKRVAAKLSAERPLKE